MGSSLVKIDLHIIFHTQYDRILLKAEHLPRLHNFISGTIKSLGGVPFKVGGIEDHVHIATTLPKSMSVPDYVKEIKRTSSIWLKKQDAGYERFSWQDGYAAFSVSPSVLPKVMEYIENQREHHSKRSFREELESFLNAYGVEYDAKYVFGE